MLIDMKYLTQSRAGIFIYRRRVPGNLLDIIGQRELKRSLDTRDKATAIARYAAAHEWAEGLLAGATSRPEQDLKRLAGRWLHAQLTEAAIETAVRKPVSKGQLSYDDEVEEPLEDLPPPLLPSPDDPGPAPWRQNQAVRAARAMGLDIRPGSRRWNEWQHEIDTVLGHLNRAEHARSWEGGVPDFIERRATMAMMPTLSDGFQHWKEKNQTASPKTLHEAQFALDRWISLHGDIPVATIKKRQVAEFRDASLNEGDGRAIGTVRKHLQAIRNFINALINDGIYEGENPAAGVGFAGIKIAKKQPRKKRAFKPEELQQLFALKTFINPPKPATPMDAAKFWLPILSLYTGARQSELIWLHNADVQNIEGVDCINIREDRDIGRTVKNEGSARLLPLHKKIIELGFLEYAAKHKGRLFDVPPDVHGTAAGLFSKHIARVINKVTDDPGVTFHSFRHTFLQATVRFRLRKDIRRRAAGHADEGVAEEFYDELAGIPLADLKEAIDQIDYPIDIAALKRAAKRLH